MADQASLPEFAQNIQPFVEYLSAMQIWRELSHREHIPLAAQAGPEDNPSPGQAIQGGDLFSHFPRAAPRDRRHQRTKFHVFRGQRYRGERHGGVGEYTAAVEGSHYIVPDEEPLPAARLGFASEHGQVLHVIFVRSRHIDPEVHISMYHELTGKTGRP